MPDRVLWADLQVLEQLSMSPTGAPAKGCYVWKIESNISIYYWWAHLDVWEANQKVRSCCHTVVTLHSLRNSSLEAFHNALEYILQAAWQ
jgi:hypothetical protein